MNRPNSPILKCTGDGSRSYGRSIKNAYVRQFRVRVIENSYWEDVEGLGATWNSPIGPSGALSGYRSNGHFSAGVRTPSP